MDKQPKLIDADKLLKAIAEKKTEHEKYREKLGVDHLYFEFHEGAVTTLEWLEKEINLGNFGSDPIPPTIKQSESRTCPQCGEVNVFNTPIDDINVPWVMCSYCRKSSVVKVWMEVSHD